MNIIKKVLIVLILLLVGINTITLAVEADVSEIDYETAKIMFYYMMFESSNQDQSARANKLIELCNSNKEQLQKLAKNYGDVTARMTQLFNENKKQGDWWDKTGLKEVPRTIYVESEIIH